MNRLMPSFQSFKLRPIGFICICLVYLWLDILAVHAANRYVSLDGTNDTTGGYTTWSGAATNIQLAVNAATDGDTVLVTNGNYRLTNVILFASANVILKSVNGRDYTFINGNYSDTTNRCIAITKDYITIDGFTISNGYAKGAEVYGGGIYADKAATVINCTLRKNSAPDGAGMMGRGVISNCVVEENTARGCEAGGLACFGLTVANCRISKNQSGGIATEMGVNTIRNCVITHNSVSVDMTTYSGVGLCCANNTTVENCTIISNYSSHGANRGGGIGMRGDGKTNILIRNCIIYSNYASSYPDWCTNNSTGMVFYSCSSSTTNGMEGGGNITNWPMFVDYSATNYRLAANSPCINTGTNQDWMTNSVDLDGRQRIRYITVDMGAYEAIYKGTIIGIH